MWKTLSGEKIGDFDRVAVTPQWGSRLALQSKNWQILSILLKIDVLRHWGCIFVFIYIVNFLRIFQMNKL